MDGDLDFSRNGTAAATAFTVCIMSVLNDFSQLSAVSPTASALTLQTSASTPPSSPAVAAIQALIAGPPAASHARPNPSPPFPSTDSTAPPPSHTSPPHLP